MALSNMDYRSRFAFFEHLFDYHGCKLVAAEQLPFEDRVRFSFLRPPRENENGVLVPMQNGQGAANMATDHITLPGGLAGDDMARAVIVQLKIKTAHVDPSSF